MQNIEQNRTNNKINREYKEIDPLRILNMKETAEKFKGIIEDRCYRAMMNWQVEITD